MTDDELLTLARACLSGESPEAISRSLVNLRAALGPEETIAMIERHRAESAEWDAHAGQWKATLDELRAEVERLTADRDAAESALAQNAVTASEEIERLARERDEARTDQAIANNLARSELAKRESAEAALAAAQKRIAELVALLSECADDLASDIEDRYRGMLDYPSMKRKYDLDMEIVKKVRAALAGGTAGDGERVAQQQRDRSAGLAAPTPPPAA